MGEEVMTYHAPAIITPISGHQAKGKTYAQGSLRAIRFSHNRPRSRRCDARYGVQHLPALRCGVDQQREVHRAAVPHAVGNLDGYDYYLNNDQWNEQSTSNQTMWLESDNDFGVCSYQPTSPNADKAYPGAVLNLNDPVGTDPPPAGPAIDSFSAISSSLRKPSRPAPTASSSGCGTSSSVPPPRPPTR